MVCPECKNDINSRSKGGCPICKTPLEIQSGVLYRTGEKSPNTQIAERFEVHIRERLSRLTSRNVPFQFGRKNGQWMKELRGAEWLLDLADNDLSFALLIVDELFSAPQFSWKQYTSILMAKADLTIAKALVLSNLQTTEENEQAMAERFESSQKGNIFGY